MTEQIIGRWFGLGGGRRDRTVLATKLYGGMGEASLNDPFLWALNIRRACDDSLRRLGTDHIDLYQMHHVDRATPWDEIWEAMEVLRGQGKIIYVGSSNFAWWHITQAQEAVRHRAAFGLVSEQSLYNLAARTVELEVLPACQGYGIGVLPWSPLHGGLLGGILRKQEAGGRSAGGRAAEALAEMRAQIEAYEAFCAERGEDPADVGLAWLLHQPRSPRRSSGRAPSRSWTGPCAPSRSRWTTRRSPAWTRSSPVPAGPPRRLMRGEPQPRPLTKRRHLLEPDL